MSDAQGRFMIKQLQKSVLFFHVSNSHLQHMKRVSASLWSCRTTSSHLIWMSLLLRASTPTHRPTFKQTYLIQSAPTQTALFFLCDRAVKLSAECDKLWKHLTEYKVWRVCICHRTSTQADSDTSNLYWEIPEQPKRIYTPFVTGHFVDTLECQRTLYSL